MLAAALAGLPLAAQARASPLQPEPEVASADIAVENYLQRLGLKTLLADHLAERLAAATGAERTAIAERLSKIYVEMLSSATDPAERRQWEARSRDLLRMVPEASSYELRLNLARVIYVGAEEILERSRLRLAKEEEVQEAVRAFRSIAPELAEIAAKLHGRVQNLERLEELGRDSETIAADLAEARRLRSLAFYYSGWTEYSLAYLTRNERLALDAQRSFGWLLNSSGGIPANLERLPTGLLKYEHIARAAVGVGLAAAVRRNDVEALRWLDAVAAGEGVAPSVLEQLLPRRIGILGEARRWADLERLIRLERRSDRGGAGPDTRPLPVVAARMLAVVTLEADKTNAAGTIDHLASIALGDLVTRGEVAQVLDLVQRYGTAPIGDTGFIVHYVRGVQAYERARAAHSASGADPEEPAADEAVVNAYRQAADLLDAAIRQDDAAQFGNERSKAGMLVGLSLYYAGDFAAAAEQFLASASAAATPAQGEEPMWLAVVSFDRAVRAGRGDLRGRRDEAAALFLQTYAGSERAAKLLVGLGASNLLDEEAAVRILLSVPSGSSVYESARREAARLLYGLYRRARASDRDFAATRFLGVAEEVLALDRRTALQGASEEARQAGDRVVLRVRQILDAALSTSAPDFSRAEAALAILDEVASVLAADLTPHRAELTFRRLQILMARQETEAAEALAVQIEEERGPFADAAQRLLYRAALANLQKSPAADQERLRAVVRRGSRIIERTGSTPEALSDPGTLSLHATVAAVAAELYDLTSDTEMRDLAVTLDTAILQAVPNNEASLRRLARMAEAAGNAETSLECWRTLASGLKTGTPDWYEARYNLIRLLGQIDPPRARDAMKQHKVLYPSYGPPPWGEKLRELDEFFGEERPPQSPLTPPSPAPGGGP